jgi:hypothetical protein
MGQTECPQRLLGMVVIRSTVKADRWWRRIDNPPYRNGMRLLAMPLTVGKIVQLYDFFDGGDIRKTSDAA